MEEQNLFNDLDSKLTININGEILKPSESKISIFDRGFLFGDSIYEVTYSVEHTLIFFSEHMKRLENSAKLIGMKIFLTREKIEKEIMKTLQVSKTKDAYIRVIITRGESAISLDPTLSFKNNLIVVVGPKPKHPKNNYINGISLFLANTLRNSIKSTNPNAKSGNYLNNVMAMAEAKEYGADDALMLNGQGELTEGTNFNIWIVKGDKYFTPPIKSGLLKGITRDKVLLLLEQNNLPYSEKTLYEDNIFDADEVFITSSTRGIMPIAKLNDQVYGNSIEDWPNIKKISNLYKELINSEIKQGSFNYK